VQLSAAERELLAAGIKLVGTAGQAFVSSDRQINEMIV